MAITREFEAFALELLSGLGPLRLKRMFGGAGLYCDDLFFALLADEAIYIKADDANEAAFVAEACPAFTYAGKNGEVLALRYRRLPDSAMDDPDEAVRWARLGVEAAARAKAPRKRTGRGR